MDYKKKIVLLGESAVGKTSLIRKFVFDQFDDSYIATIGSKITKKEIAIKRRSTEDHIKLLIWDLIGREGYHGLHARTIAGVHGAIVVADLTRRETLGTLERYWIPFLFKVVGNVPLVFVCNKSDLKSEFEYEPDEIHEMASRYNGSLDGILPGDLRSCYATSARTGDNVQNAFESMGHMLVNDDKITDPVKELYESMVVTGIQRDTDMATVIGVLDAVIIDFCQGFSDPGLAMLLLRTEVARAGMDINNPTGDELKKLVEFLAEAENEYHEHATVMSNLKRRKEWLGWIKE